MCEWNGLDAEGAAHVGDVEGFVFGESAKLVGADPRQTRHQSKDAGGEEEWTERDRQDRAGAEASGARNGTDESGVRDRFGAGDDDAGRGAPRAGKGCADGARDVLLEDRLDQGRPPLGRGTIGRKGSRAARRWTLFSPWAP